MAMAHRGLKFYHICKLCEAKFFSPREIEQCPRCGALSGSRERLVPPWQAKDARAQAPPSDGSDSRRRLTSKVPPPVADRENEESGEHPEGRRAHQPPTPP